MVVIRWPLFYKQHLTVLLIIQWGSEIEPFEIRTFCRSDFKWSGFSYGYPNHSKTGPFKIPMFCPDLNWLLTKCGSFVYISNSQASGVQIPFKIQTICNPTTFWTFEIQTSPNFRSPQYLYSGDTQKWPSDASNP